MIGRLYETNDSVGEPAAASRTSKKKKKWKSKVLQSKFKNGKKAPIVWNIRITIYRVFYRCDCDVREYFCEFERFSEESHRQKRWGKLRNSRWPMSYAEKCPCSIASSLEAAERNRETNAKLVQIDWTFLWRPRFTIAVRLEVRLLEMSIFSHIWTA